MSELLDWLRQQLDDDEQIAREASRTQFDPRPMMPGGEHWQWEDCDTDEVIVIDPLTDEYVGGVRASLRSVEQYPSSSVGDLPHFVISNAEEVPAVCGMHIARWDPARVLADIDAKRKILDMLDLETNDGAEVVRGPEDEVGWRVVRLLAEPFADRPGYQESWRP